MNYSGNESTPQGTRINRGGVTSRYKKYRPPILVDLGGFGDGLVTKFWRRLVLRRYYQLPSGYFRRHLLSCILPRFIKSSVLEEALRAKYPIYCENEID